MLRTLLILCCLSVVASLVPAARPVSTRRAALATAATLPLASPASTATVTTATAAAAPAAALAFAPREAALIARLTRLGALGGEQGDGAPPLTQPKPQPKLRQSPKP